MVAQELFRHVVQRVRVQLVLAAHVLQQVDLLHPWGLQHEELVLAVGPAVELVLSHRAAALHHAAQELQVHQGVARALVDQHARAAGHEAPVELVGVVADQGVHLVLPQQPGPALDDLVLRFGPDYLDVIPRLGGLPQAHHRAVVGRGLAVALEGHRDLDQVVVRIVRHRELAGGRARLDVPAGQHQGRAPLGQRRRAGPHGCEEALDLAVDIRHQVLGRGPGVHAHPAAGPQAAQVQQPDHRVHAGLVGLVRLVQPPAGRAAGRPGVEGQLREQLLPAGAEAPQRLARDHLAAPGQAVVLLARLGQEEAAARRAPGRGHLHKEVGREHDVCAHRLPAGRLAEAGHPEGAARARVARGPGHREDIHDCLTKPRGPGLWLSGAGGPRIERPHLHLSSGPPQRAIAKNCCGG